MIIPSQQERAEIEENIREQLEALKREEQLKVHVSKCSRVSDIQ